MAGKILNFASPTATYDLTQAYLFYPTSTPNSYWASGANGEIIVPGGDTGMPNTYARLSNGQFDNFLGFGLPSFTPSLSTMSLSADFRITTNIGDADALTFYIADTSYHGQYGILNNTTYDWLNTGTDQAHMNTSVSCPPATITLGIETYKVNQLSLPLGFYFHFKDKNNNYVPLLTAWNPFNYLDGSSHRVLTNIAFSGTSLFLNVSAIRYCYGLQASSDSLSNNQWVKATPVTYVSAFSASNSIINYFLPRLVFGSWIGGSWDTKDVCNVNFLAYTTNTIKFLENTKSGGQGTSTVKFISNTKTISPILSQYLLVGGGGAGGGAANGGAGGGAGGVTYGNNLSLASGTTYNVTIGLGGTITSAVGNNGGNTSIVNVLTAFGGGGGGSGQAGDGTSGGSGGGSATLTTAAGTLGQGNAGGSGVDYSPNYYANAGGGGGAGGVGGNATASRGGTGGVGGYYSIQYYSGYYGGGGGGGTNYAGPGGTGGLGGGGNGGSANGAILPTPGTPNTGGGGGGGGGFYSAQSGGTGVAVLIIPSYHLLSYTGPGVTATTFNSYTVLQFTSSGTFTTA